MGFDDKLSLRSGPIECIGVSSLRMEVPGQSIIRFQWKTDTAPRMGSFLFKVDNIKQYECLPGGWNNHSAPLSAGTNHTLEWSFRKTKSYPLWSGSGWIDNISLIRMAPFNPDYSNATIPITNVGVEGPTSIKGSEQRGNAISNGYALPVALDMKDKSIPDLAPNITVSINNFTYLHAVPIHPLKANIAIKQISPDEDEILSMDELVKFRYELFSNKTVINCTLLIDDVIWNSSRNIRNNVSNVLIPDREFEEEGLYRWKVRCCDCGIHCNSTEDNYFRVSRNNFTARVNQASSEESRFIYRDIKSAINRTNSGGTVVIDGGIYEEPIIIDKPLTILGKNWPVVTSKGGGGTITIRSGDVNITGLTIRGVYSGIVVDGSGKELKNITIYNNNISESSTGVRLMNCSNSTIRESSIYNLKPLSRLVPVGIEMIKCKSCGLIHNNINELNKTKGRMDTCVYIEGWDNYTIKNNTFSLANTGISIKDSKIVDQAQTEELLKYYGNIFISCVPRNVSVR